MTIRPSDLRTIKSSMCTLVRLSACLLVCAFTSRAHADALVEYENAVGNESRGEYYTAILNLRRCLTENPNYVPAHLLLGDVFVKLGKFADADSAYVTAEQSDPQSIEAVTHRLRLYALHLKDFTRAEEMLKTVTSRFSQSPDIHYYRAVVLVGRHKYLEAREALELSVALREKFFDARRLQLEIESIAGDSDRIMGATDRLLEEFPELIETYDLTLGHLLKAKYPVDKILEKFSRAPQALLLNPQFSRLLARLNLMADRYEAAAEILKDAGKENLTADEVEDLVYLKSLAEVAGGRHLAGIQLLYDYLREVPDRPYLLMQLDLWLLRYMAVSDPLRIRRADDRSKIGAQLMAEGRPEVAFMPLYLARKLNLRDKNIRRQFSEAAWQVGLAETAREEMDIARDLDPLDDAIQKRAAGIGAEATPTPFARRRTYNLYVFRLADDPSSIRPSFGRLFTDAIAVYASALSAFKVQALEPAVPFEKAEEVAHQRGADFFFHGQIGFDQQHIFDAALGIFPVGGRSGSPSLDFKEQHVALRSSTDFTEDLIFDTIKSLHLTSSQYAMVVRKEREGLMIVDLGRRHGLNSTGQFSIQVQGRPLLVDVLQIFEWFTRARVQEIERVRFIGIGDYLQQVER